MWRSEPGLRDLDWRSKIQQHGVERRIDRIAERFSRIIGPLIRHRPIRIVTVAPAIRDSENLVIANTAVTGNAC